MNRGKRRGHERGDGEVGEASEHHVLGNAQTRLLQRLLEHRRDRVVAADECVGTPHLLLEIALQGLQIVRFGVEYVPALRRLHVRELQLRLRTRETVRERRRTELADKEVDAFCPCLHKVLRYSRTGFKVVDANDIVVAPLREWHYVAVDEDDGNLLLVEEFEDVRVDLVAYGARKRLVDYAREVALYELGGELSHLCDALLAVLAPHLAEAQLVACLACEPVDFADDRLEEIGDCNARYDQADLPRRCLPSDERAGTWRCAQKPNSFQLGDRPHGSRPGGLESPHDPRQARERMRKPVLPGAYLGAELVCNGKISAAGVNVVHAGV